MQRGRSTTEQGAYRFGRTVISVVTTPPDELGVEAIVSPANSRGVMGVGTAGLLRLRGGGEIEREAMAVAPLTVGTVVVTTAGDLQRDGTRFIFHAVIANALGSPTREQDVRQATVAWLEAAARERVRSLAVPILRSGQSLLALSSEAAFSVMIEEIIAHLRRYPTRISRIVILAQDGREREMIGNVLDTAHTLWWEIRT